MIAIAPPHRVRPSPAPAHGAPLGLLPPPDVCARAARARDPRFDGIFYVGITTTRIYCRPVCPARVSYPDRRRFFPSPAAAEAQGYRPCLRCRPELAPGRSLLDAVPRIASAAALRIAAGGLNGRSVADLARELGVSERHLRRALQRELGVSPVELALTHRLLLAKRLLTDTGLSVTRIAFASGFQSLRRFNSVFREHYRMSPTDLRRRAPELRAGSEPGLIELRLSYRLPFAWDALLATLAAEATPGVETVASGRYARTVALAGARGVLIVDPARASSPARKSGRSGGIGTVAIRVTEPLLPALMPLLARVRHLLDLDAEPAVIDGHLAETGLGALVRRRPGLRLPGALDGFEVAAREVLRRAAGPSQPGDLAGRLVQALGEPIETGLAGLTRLWPSPDRVAEAGVGRLRWLGIPAPGAEAVVGLARAVTERRLRLEPGADVAATSRVLEEITDLGLAGLAATVTRALHWPDAFWAGDSALGRLPGLPNPVALRARAERWRPWRGYAASHLRLAAADGSTRTRAARRRAVDDQQRSSTIAIPCPTPMQSVQSA